MLHLLEAPTNFRSAEAAMAAKGPNRGDLARTGPASDRLRVDPEESGDLGRRQEGICLRLFSHGVKPLELSDSSSTYGTDTFGNMARSDHLWVTMSD